MSADDTAARDDELAVVHQRRYQEALDAGLTDAEAELFADGGCDVGLLRRLVAGHCPADLLAEIVT